MSYENGKDLYSMAFITASGAALLIAQPWAFYVASMIGVMVSNPGQMADSARTWRTTDNGGTTSELNSLKTELGAMKTELGDKWEGAAFEQFVQAYDGYVKSLETLESTRNATGEALDQSAKLYYVGAFICLSVASLMTVVGLWVGCTRGNPFTAAMARVLLKKIQAIATPAVRKVLLKHGIALAVIGYLFKEAVRSSEAAGKIFPMVNGIPNEFTTLKSGNMPAFTRVGIDYEQQSGTLIPKMEDPTGKGGLS
ncbi:WXG100 family type VII secretion target [Nonomuraea endophytica]|uniref:WXG100 family type VII secretion target n=1 Tax=Nonomuraea endophytica TaxID=714136 RepID=UPI0037CB92A6